MAVQWFYGATHAKLGPFTAKQLRELKVLGRLKATDMVWKEGVKNGLAAGEIRGLFESMPANAVVMETADLPIPAAVPTEAAVVPAATEIPVAAQQQVPEIIPEPLESKALEDDRESTLRAADTLLALQNTPVPIETEREPPPAETCETVSKPKDLVTPASDQPRAKPAPVKMRRATVECGAIIISQDGDRVRFRKKCVRCGFEESCNSVMRLMPGVNRQLFFCPKCRKQVGIAIRAV
jgi:GYF domain 2